MTIDSTLQNAAEELTKLGGARVILATVTDAKSMSSVVAGLGIDGRLLVLGASAEPIEVSPLLLIGAAFHRGAAMNRSRITVVRPAHRARRAPHICRNRCR